MLFHTVLFQFSDGTSQDVIDEILHRHRELGAIPAVQEIAVGTNQMPVTDGWTHGMTIVFESRDSMMAEFAEHPLHQQVFSEARAAFSRFMAMDVESGGN